jgi:hypothetical protein
MELGRGIPAIPQREGWRFGAFVISMPCRSASKQAMAQLVAHLEEHGYVERVPDPHDRRAKLVRTTERGREVFAIARAFLADVEPDSDND